MSLARANELRAQIEELEEEIYGNVMHGSLAEVVFDLRARLEDLEIELEEEEQKGEQ